MPDGLTPKPIIVEEVLTAEGYQTSYKAQHIICTDGLANGLTHNNYLSTGADGDLVMIDFKSDSMIDIDLDVIIDNLSGWQGLFVDSVFFSELDLSYPVAKMQRVSQTGFLAGNHRLELINSDAAGPSTLPDVEHPRFAFDAATFYDFTDAVYTTSVEYVETDPTTWNKVVIKPDKTNTKANGVPEITAEGVPIRYRARVKYEKPVGDMLSSTVLVTAIQAELGENESFTRLNYGPGSMPPSVLQLYNKDIEGSGITAYMYEEYITQHTTEESGVQERHIADAQITPRKLAQGAVVADKIAEGNVGYTKLAAVDKHSLAMNVSLSDYRYPIVLPVNTNPAIRYIPAEVEIGSENIWVNGQMQFVGDDYTIETVVAAQRIDDPTVNSKAAKITFTRTILPTDKVWGNYFVVI
jgi:hypothetical protein